MRRGGPGRGGRPRRGPRGGAGVVQAELGAVEATTPPSISETRLSVPGRYLLEVARQGQAAAAEVVGLDGLAGGPGGVGDGGQRAHVVELQVRRVVEVDVGVAAPRRGPAGGRSRSASSARRAVVRRLGVAPAGAVRRPEGAAAQHQRPTTSSPPRTADERPAATSSTPRPTRIALTGTREISTKPVDARCRRSRRPCPSPRGGPRRCRSPRARSVAAW